MHSSESIILHSMKPFFTGSQLSNTIISNDQAMGSKSASQLFQVKGAYKP